MTKHNTDNPIDFFLPNKTTKGGKGSGNWGHGGLPGVHGGSSPTKNLQNVTVDFQLTATLPEPTEVELDMLQKELKGGGFSYNPVTDKAPKTGYMVSDNKPTRIISKEEPNREVMRTFIQENIEKFRESENTYFGGWVTEKDTHFDISRNFQGLQEACLRGLSQDQIGIFDLSVFDTLYSTDYLDHIDKSMWTKKKALQAYNAHMRRDEPKPNFADKYRDVFQEMFGSDFLTNFKSKERLHMTDKETKRTHAWANKPKKEWTEEDWDDYSYYQNNRKPMRFQFGPDTTDKDIDRFLDKILGPDPKKAKQPPSK